MIPMTLRYAQRVRSADNAVPDRLWRSPTYLIRQLAGRSGKLLSDRLAGPGPATDYAFLAALVEFGPASQAELGRRLGFDRSDVVAILNRLQTAGLVLRTLDERDRRRNTVSVTPAGERLLVELDGRVDAAQTDLVEPLSSAERSQLVALLQRVLAHLDSPSRGAGGEKTMEASAHG